MTIVGAGGISFDKLAKTKGFERDWKKLSPQLKIKASEKIKWLLQNPRPPGLAFEKLKSISNPSVFTIHIDGNYKLSLAQLTEYEGDKKVSIAVLRRIATHKEIDRAP